MFNNKIIGYCFTLSARVIKYNKQIKTYEKINLDDAEIEKIMKNQVTLPLYIGGLCKDSAYANVGSFLLDEIYKYHQKINEEDNEDYNAKIYLCPGSDKHINNYERYINNNPCIIYDDDKYYESNMKLIKYYKKNNYFVSKNLYMIDKCNEPNQYIFSNIMYRKL